MHTKRKLAAVLGAVSAPVLVLTSVTQASAHGYVDAPPSRQAQCAAGTVQCGDITWEPQSVEGPKGQRSCSGGNERFAELDDDSKAWKATDVGRSQQFRWRLTARHATSTWEYFVDGRKIHEVNDGGARPGETVTHTVDFGGLTGRHKVLAIWNVADTTNAFYACVDVNIKG